MKLQIYSLYWYLFCFRPVFAHGKHLLWSNDRITDNSDGNHKNSWVWWRAGVAAVLLYDEVFSRSRFFLFFHFPRRTNKFLPLLVVRSHFFSSLRILLRCQCFNVFDQPLFRSQFKNTPFPHWLWVWGLCHYTLFYCSSIAIWCNICFFGFLLSLTFSTINHQFVLNFAQSSY